MESVKGPTIAIDDPAQGIEYRPSDDYKTHAKPVPDSECEFWAHIGLRAEHDWAVKLWAGLKEDV